jgi:exonuclease SbcC
MGDDVDLPIDHFEQLVSAAKAAVVQASAAVEERTGLTSAVVAISEDRERLASRASELDLEIARLGAARSAAADEVDTARGSLGELVERFDTEGAALVEVFDRRAQALGQIETAATAWSAALSTHEGTCGALRGAEDLLTDAVVTSGFADLSEARAAVLDPTERNSLEAEVATHESVRARVEARLPELEALDLPVDCPDITALQADAITKRSAASELASGVSRIDERLGEVGALNDLTAARAITETAAAAFERSDQLTSLSHTCNGQGPRKVSLETWVLAGELDRVALAASIHLERMTAGRYRLERTDAADHGGAQAGLDLRVRDAHTGISRRPGSLSGGEQFQASLALALGLADVVSQGGSASGRVFEALFVDEGFGSLDPESLDKAVDALHQIHDTGRIVGVITHVEAMKEDLRLGIRVDRLPDGNGSTLRCHPADLT